MRPDCCFRSERDKMLGRKSLLMLIQNTVSGIIGYFGLIFILRYAGLEPYGIVQFSLSFLGLFSFILDMSFSTANIKKISEGMDFDVAITTYFILKIILAMIFVGVIISYLFIWRYFFNGHFVTPFEEDVIIIMVPYYILQSFVVYFQSNFNAKMKAAILSIPRLIESIFRNIMYIVTGYFIARVMIDKNAYSMIIALIMVITYGLYVLMFAYYAKDWKFKRPKFEHFKEYYIFAIPLSISAIFGTIAANFNNVIIDFFWGPYYVGAYASILAMITFISATSGTLSAFILPTLSSMKAIKNKDYSTTINTMEKYISLAILPIIVFILLFSKQVLNLSTAQLIPFSLIIMVLSLIVYLNTLNTPYSTHFYAIGKTKFIMYTGIISSSIMIIFDLILVPSMFLGIHLFGLSALGAAISNLIATVVSFIIIRIYVYKSENIIGTKNVLYQLFAAILTGLIIYSLKMLHFPTYQWWALILWALLAYLIFFLISRLLKIIDKEDIRYILEMINPKEMVTYIKEELKR
ncbi:MAG: oligosaccharide flippase family protein [Thermoplasmata archaeon]